MGFKVNSFKYDMISILKRIRERFIQTYRPEEIYVGRMNYIDENFNRVGFIGGHTDNNLSAFKKLSTNFYYPIVLSRESSRAKYVRKVVIPTQELIGERLHFVLEPFPMFNDDAMPKENLSGRQIKKRLEIINTVENDMD